ncbi:hypothetical protein GJ496_006753 [Pomphorhynchus laevis]|nr:hypothetical protein GJ496_006753 [Pomphorhynchus laevis]
MGWPCYIMYAAVMMLLCCDCGNNIFDELTYRHLTIHGYCVRRFNGTQEFGCSDSGIGILTSSDQFFGNNNSKTNVILLMNLNEFYEDGVQQYLINDTRIKGILLDASGLYSGLSDDSKCPNYLQESNISKQCLNWNSVGSNTFFRRFHFPIMTLTNTTQLSDLRQSCCVNGTFHDQCYVELVRKMRAVGNSYICSRRNNNKHAINFDMTIDDNKRFCTGSSRYNLMVDVGAAENVAAKLMLIGRSDNIQMFPQVPTGFISPGSSIITLLIIAKYLSNLNSSVKLALFNGESLQYTGSNQYLNNHKENNTFDVIIELGQLFSSDTLYLHSFTADTWPVNIQQRNYKLQSSFLEDKYFKNATQAKQLPPCSIENFLRHRPVSNLLLTDYETKYKSLFFHSVLDTCHTHHIYIQRIAKHCRAISDSITRWLNSSSVEFDFDKHIPSIYECMFQSMNCSLLVKLSKAYNITVDFDKLNRPMNFYAFSSGPDLALLSLIFRYVSARVDLLHVGKQECFQHGGAYVVSNDSEIDHECIVNRNFNQYTVDESNLYWDKSNPFWTESIEDDELMARYFLKPYINQWLPLTLGICLTILPSAFIYIGRKRIIA